MLAHSSCCANADIVCSLNGMSNCDRSRNTSAFLQLPLYSQQFWKIIEWWLHSLPSLSTHLAPTTMICFSCARHIKPNELSHLHAKPMFLWQRGSTHSGSSSSNGSSRCSQSGKISRMLGSQNENFNSVTLSNAPPPPSPPPNPISLQRELLSGSVQLK